MDDVMPRLGRRRFGARLLAGGVGAVWSSVANAQAQRRVSLGWVKSTANLLAPTSVEVAPRHGLSIDSQNFNTASDVMTAVIGKQLDVGLLTPIHLLRSIELNLDLVQIAGNTRGNTGIVIAGKSGIGENDWGGLKALNAKRKLKVASSRGSINEMLAIAEFRTRGLDLLKEFDLVNIANFAQHPQALRSGEVDMIVTLEPLVTLVVADGTGMLFNLPYDSAAKDLNTNYVVRREWLEGNVGLAAAFVASLADSVAVLKDKKVELATARKTTGLPADVLQTALARSRYELRNGVPETMALAKIALETRYISRDVSGEIGAHVEERLLGQAGVSG